METTQKSICELCMHLPICKHTPQASCSYWTSKEPKKPLEPQAPAQPKRAFLRSLWRWCMRIAVVVCIILSFAAGVLVTWYGFAPRIVSLVPKISQPPKPSVPPDEIIKQFFQAARLADKEKLLSLAHPEMITENSYQLANLLDTDAAGVRGWAALREITIMSVTVPEETAEAVISLTSKDGHANSGRVALKKYQGEWRILNVN